MSTILRPRLIESFSEKFVIFKHGDTENKILFKMENMNAGDFQYTFSLWYGANY